MNQWLLASSSFSCLLLLARVIATGYLTYAFLVWNLFLAFIPYLLTRKLSHNLNGKKSKSKLIVMLLAWLLFIPNSFYIITDLFHLNLNSPVPKWFDLLMIFSFAWNGIIFGIISLRKVEMIVENISGKKFSMLLVFIVMVLIAYGIYIGRYLRFNSWDVILNPFSLAGDILNMLLHPFDHFYPWSMVMTYSLFMTIFYLTIKKISEYFYITSQSIKS